MVLIRERRWRWLLVLTHILALAPLALLAWDYTQDRLTANPIREITLRTGRYALILLILSLACTPIDILTGFKPVLRLRRPLGLYAFLYASLHLLTFAGLDYSFDLGLIAGEVTEKSFVQVGLLAFLVLLSLLYQEMGQTAGQELEASASPGVPGGVACHIALCMARQGRRSQATGIRCSGCDVARHPHPDYPESHRCPPSDVVPRLYPLRKAKSPTLPRARS
jgi:hypothetical protein